MSSNEKLEREFAAFLAEDDSRLAALYRKLPQAEPDPRLDGAVRAMAHRALNPQLVATPQASSPHRRRGRWLPALGAAAGIVFAAGIAFRVGPSWHGDRGETGAPASDVISVRSVDAPPPAAPPLSPAPPPAESAATPAGAASLSGMAKLKAQAETEAAKPASDAEARERSARLDDSADNRPSAAGGLSKAEKPTAPRAQPQAFPAPAPAPARKRASELDAVERKQIMATGAWQNLHDRDTKKPAPGAAPAVPSGAGTRPAAAAKSAELQRQEALPAAPPAPAQGSALAPASRDEAAPPPPAAVATVPEQFAPQPPARTAAAPAAKTDAQAGDEAVRDKAAVPAISGKAAQTKENEKTRSKDPNASLYPEHWLQNIRVMLRENHRDGAVRSLAEFRKMYPDYKLPDDLRDLK
ncbi:MAG TPA: hypothetical protein VFI49_06825 [Rudaea sp.]|nr:hypothetical protein [Rudaea sp.]